MTQRKQGLTPSEIPENIYGHKKRLLWIMKQLNKHAASRPVSEINILEIGCGTGVMLSMPLASLGYNVTGVDTDEKSIELAKKTNPYRNAQFLCQNAGDLKVKFNVIILSEVLEHLKKPEALLEVSRELLIERGLLIITVPNGYGWFELENFLWERLKLGEILSRLRILWLMNMIKWPTWQMNDYPSTLSNSPHVQRFTRGKIEKMMAGANFHILDTDGSTLIAGKFSNLLFSGFKLVLKINDRLGSLFKNVASDYYYCCLRAE
jgi:SAM-dependent methyltransferase